MLRDCGTKLPRTPAEFKHRRRSTRTQWRRRAQRQDRRGIPLGVGGAGRVGQMGRHDRHTYVKAPETTSPDKSGAKRAKVRASLKSRRTNKKH